MAHKEYYVVLKVVDGAEGFMATYAPQVAMAHEYDSPESAACFNVGSYPDADKRGKPYRSIVIPWSHWNEYEVFAESHKGRRHFAAYPSENLTIRSRGDGEPS